MICVGGIGIGSQITKLEILQWFQCKTQGFTSFDFISKETLFTFPFSIIGLGFAICTDDGTINF